MHRSRLSGFIIDCKTGDLDEAAAFWSAALGYPARRSDDPAEENYVYLDSGREDLHVEVQRVKHESRVHIDIEADDIEAEVARLEQLGAKRLESVKGWVVMQAPTGQRFCVVRPQSESFAASANEWS